MEEKLEAFDNGWTSQADSAFSYACNFQDSPSPSKNTETPRKVLKINQVPQTKVFEQVSESSSSESEEEIVVNKPVMREFSCQVTSESPKLVSPPVQTPPCKATFESVCLSPILLPEEEKSLSVRSIEEIVNTRDAFLDTCERNANYSIYLRFYWPVLINKASNGKLDFKKVGYAKQIFKCKIYYNDEIYMIEDIQKPMDPESTDFLGFVLELTGAKKKDWRTARRRSSDWKSGGSGSQKLLQQIKNCKEVKIPILGSAYGGVETKENKNSIRIDLFDSNADCFYGSTSLEIVELKYLDWPVSRTKEGDSSDSIDFEKELEDMLPIIFPIRDENSDSEELYGLPIVAYWDAEIKALVHNVVVQTDVIQQIDKDITCSLRSEQEQEDREETVPKSELDALIAKNIDNLNNLKMYYE
ncbi:hypothetical protein Ciccas_002600 [Cichlidogyrus casuarinus]|uniref:Uncharacterized protein n=1 Tax=Cichlidogyrus casuarinus TaxID=1844966 RepID=A0ABD2QGT6_9PLAT